MGGLLTDKQRDALDMYVNEDLSLSEIAENAGTSRQAAQDSIKKAAQRLREWEDALGICRKQRLIEAELAASAPWAARQKRWRNQSAEFSGRSKRWHLKVWRKSCKMCLAN